MKKLVMMTLLMICTSVSAEILPHFYKSERAFLFMSNKDQDVQPLFDAMNVAADDIYGIANKSINLVDENDLRIFSMVCTTSKFVPMTNSCTLNFNTNEHTVINGEDQTVTFNVTDREVANELASAFNFRGDGHIFTSKDGVLDMYLVRDVRGNVTSFKITYN
ncbi:MAG: hypothetical protein KC478_14170 [Bacteriovoracaceae bacterium]|nr:hypothetical protein [Bacteriovoracaceae bacterium]